MFAIGYIDKVNHKLILVRDRLGVKPLYYYKTGSSFYFSSEPKGIICQKNFKKELIILKFIIILIEAILAMKIPYLRV